LTSAVLLILAAAQLAQSEATIGRRKDV